MNFTTLIMLNFTAILAIGLVSKGLLILSLSYGLTCGGDIIYSLYI